MITLFDMLTWNAKEARATWRREFLATAAWLIAIAVIVALMLAATAGLGSDKNPRKGGVDRQVVAALPAREPQTGVGNVTALADSGDGRMRGQTPLGDRYRYEAVGDAGCARSAPRTRRDEQRPSVHRILDAIRQVESSGNPNPPDGDNLHAIGPYQIHREYWLDARMPSGTYQDCRREDYARRVVTAYLARYAPGGSAERLARVHNGGPAGYLNPQTAGYWRKVSKELKTGGF